MKTKKKEIPVFYDPADGSWHYQKKYLSTDLQIQFRVSKEGYDTPEEAMRSYLRDSELFSEKMKTLKEKQPGNIDFRQELLKWYHNTHLAEISGSTVVTSSYVLYHFVQPNLGFLGDKKLDQVTAADINKLILSLNQCCDTAQAQTYKFLKGFFEAMRVSQKIRSNPMEQVTPYYFNSRRKEIPDYTEKEIAALLDSAKGSIHFFDIYCMLLGLRTGEIRGLKESDFNQEEKTLHISRQIVRQDETSYSADGKVAVTKTGVALKATKTPSSNRVIRVPDITFDLLKDRQSSIHDAQKRRAENDLDWDDTFAFYLCRSDTGKIKSEATLNQALKRICSSARLPIVSPHDLRHITATLMFEYALKNAEQPSEEILKRVSEYLGHASVNTTFDIYMDYVRNLSRIRQVSENLMDPFNEFLNLGGGARQ